MPSLIQIIQGAPIWVWPLLAALVWLGLRSSKRRTTPTWLMAALPLMGLISLLSLSQQPHSTYVWSAFFIAYAVGARWGYRRQGDWLIAKKGGRLTLEGEWVTLTTLMIIFWSNFASGVARAMTPHLAHSLWFAASIAALVGLTSGSLGGRAWMAIRSPNQA